MHCIIIIYYNMLVYVVFYRHMKHTHCLLQDRVVWPRNTNPDRNNIYRAHRYSARRPTTASLNGTPRAYFYFILSIHTMGRGPINICCLSCPHASLMPFALNYNNILCYIMCSRGRDVRRLIEISVYFFFFHTVSQHAAACVGLKE